MAEKLIPDKLICECAISYHTEIRNGRVVQVLDGDLPDIMTMCVGRCERCGLPFHHDFPHSEEPGHL